jgi:hypothetical protein
MEAGGCTCMLHILWCFVLNFFQGKQLSTNKVWHFLLKKKQQCVTSHMIWWRICSPFFFSSDVHRSVGLVDANNIFGKFNFGIKHDVICEKSSFQMFNILKIWKFRILDLFSFWNFWNIFFWNIYCDIMKDRT